MSRGLRCHSEQSEESPGLKEPPIHSVILGKAKNPPD